MSLPHEMMAFVRVVDKGSFAAAAAELELTPSAVSKIVSRLEQRLSSQLLTRTTRRLTLTAEGETYLARARDILAAIEAAEAEVTSSGRLLRGHIRISTGTAIGRRQLMKLLPEFLAAHPGMTTDLIVSDHRVDLIDENVDVALRAGDLPDSSLTARKIAVAKRLICASPQYLAKYGAPSTPLDLQNHNCILIEGLPHLARWPFHIAEGVSRIQVKGNLTTDNADVMRDLAIAGHGIVRMIDIHLADAVRSGLLVSLLADQHVDEPLPIWAVASPGRNRVPRVRAFLDFLAEQYGKAEE